MSNATLDHILDVAEDMLLNRGFNAFSYKDIAEKVGIRKASIHYYFPSKADLGVALIRRYRERFTEWAAELASKGKNPVEQLDAYFDFYVEIIKPRTKICLNGVLGAAFNALPENVRKELQVLMREQHEWLCNLLKQGRLNGLFHEHGSVEAQSAWLGSAIQGALQIARTSENERVFFAVLSQLKKTLIK